MALWLAGVVFGAAAMSVHRGKLACTACGSPRGVRQGDSGPLLCGACRRDGVHRVAAGLPTGLAERRATSRLPPDVRRSAGSGPSPWVRPAPPPGPVRRLRRWLDPTCAACGRWLGRGWPIPETCLGCRLRPHWDAG